MPLVSSSIPNLVNGVSQQPYSLRLASQAEAQENGLSTVSQGLKKRPPTRHIKKILNTPLGSAYLHTINRDTQERYTVVITNGDLQVFDLDGVEKTVNFPDGLAYLASADAATGFQAITVADYTFIVNKGITVGESVELTPSRPFEALLSVRTGLYGKQYEVLIDGVGRGSVTTPDGSLPAHVLDINTDTIAADLETQINTLAAYTPLSVTGVSYSDVFPGLSLRAVNFTLPGGSTTSNTELFLNGVQGGFVQTGPTTFATYFDSDSFGMAPTVTARQPTGTGTQVTVVRYGSVLHISSPVDFTIECRDGFNNAAMLAIKGEVQRFSDLPANAGAQDFTVKVAGDSTSEFDDYYVRYDKASTNVGVWKECAQPGITAGATFETMPWGLVRESGGDFTFKILTWDYRKVGDVDSAPHPSFLGRKINGLFFYRNRLGLVADESVVMSEAGQFFNFYPTTVTTLLDSDRIDVTTSHTKVSNLVAAVPFSRKLLLFSAQTQFVVEGGDLLTPKTVSIQPTTEYECTTGSMPITVNNQVYFAVPKGDYSGVREYFTDRVSEVNEALDITSHVPKYLPSGIFKLAAALNDDVFGVLSVNERSSIYVYKFYWNGDEKLQSSWSKWTFPETDEILNVDFIQSELFLVINRPDGVYLESLEISLGQLLGNEPYQVHLDRKLTVPKASLTYVAPHTIIDPAALPWEPDDGDYVAVVATGQPKDAGTLADVLWDGTTIKLLGNFTNNDLIVGRKYAFRYKFSTLLPRAQRQGGEKADTVATLQLRKMQINYADTGYFQARVTPQGRDTYTYTFTGKVLGLGSATVGEAGLDTGNYSFPILTRNTTADIELYSDSPLPCTFLSADWEGFYAKRSRGV